jgi:hypothetical protein
MDPACQAPVGDVWAAGLMSTAQRGQVSEKERVHYYILVYYLLVITLLVLFWGCEGEGVEGAAGQAAHTAHRPSK